jgi:hypothetical protein
MTTPTPPCRPLTAGSFVIVEPFLDQRYLVDANGNVLVIVDNLSSSNNGFQAVITDIGGSAASPLVQLNRIGTGNRWTGLVNAGIIPTSCPDRNNKTVTVQAITGMAGADMDSNNFKAYRNGSGSGTVPPPVAIAALRDRFTQKDSPIPVSLTLTLDAPVKPGTSPVCAQINLPTPLVYSQDANHFSSWYSGPLVFCNTSGETGYWILDKSAPRAWTLLLRRAEALVATYTLTTDTDATFPLRLQLRGEGGGECVGWPASVTVTPAS